MSLFDKTVQQLQEDVMRLVSMRIEVPSAETCIAMAAKFGEDWRPRASLVVELEPMTYRLAYPTDAPTVNRHEIARIPITFSSTKNGLTAAQLEPVREMGWKGIPAEKVVTLPRNYKNRKPETLNMPYQRWASYANGAHLDIDTDDTGHVTSKDYGALFVVLHGSDEFPKADNSTYNRWIYYIARRAPEDFVALSVEERPTKLLKVFDADEEATTVSLNGTGPTLTADAIADALEAAEIFGKVRVAAFKTPEEQEAIISRSFRKAPILADGQVMNRVADGTFLDWIIEIGAASVSAEGKLVRA